MQPEAFPGTSIGVMQQAALVVCTNFQCMPLSSTLHAAKSGGVHENRFEACGVQPAAWAAGGIGMMHGTLEVLACH